MVSSFSNPGFPLVHTHPTRLLAMDERLSAAIDSFEVSMRVAACEAMDSVRDAIHKAMNPVLAEIHSESIEVGHQKPQNGDGNPLRIPSTIHNHSIQPLLSSSPTLRALANSAIKPHSNNSAASTVLLSESKTMTSTPQLCHKHSFFDVTKTGPEVVLNSSFISANSEAKFLSSLTDNYPLNLAGSYINNSIMNTLSRAVIEYRCESCPRVQVIPDQCWFSYLEQLILKHGFAASAIWIKQMVNEISYEEKTNVSHVEIKIIESKSLDEKSSPVDIMMFWLAKSVVGINQTPHSVGLDDIELDAQGDLSGDPSRKVPIEENLVKVHINSDYDFGLFYLGNTCYMNSTIQFLHSVPELKSVLIKYSHFERNDEGDQASHRLTIATCALISELDKGSSESPDSVKALFGIELVSMVHYIESGEKGSNLSKLVLRLEKIQPSKVEVKKAELLGIGWTFEFGKKIMPKKGTMTTSQMAVAKLVAMCRRPIILPKFRVDGITYNPLDGVILNWPTDQMDASLQMIARVAAVCKNASITQAKQKYDALGMPTQAAPKYQPGFCSPSFGALPWSDNRSRKAYDEFTTKKVQDFKF
ncbi:hypothetical protein D8674_010502 [Pyrus ussuriensis x Pyrus communis]|uniref:ubiquitinyl hydrolase 1 n=1 Tax=Pyrus ussuriensis x Pyrus communis TaxID=2448454 RepID=A0A5N5FEF3_9ROSA|nr:hypothetical protein D8674_010502 [Pyrus ussuriensis x Pyrus communis]